MTAASGHTARSVVNLQHWRVQRRHCMGPPVLLKWRVWYTNMQFGSGQHQTSMRVVGMALFLHQWQDCDRECDSELLTKTVLWWQEGPSSPCSGPERLCGGIRDTPLGARRSGSAECGTRGRSRSIGTLWQGPPSPCSRGTTRSRYPFSARPRPSRATMCACSCLAWPSSYSSVQKLALHPPEKVNS